MRRERITVLEVFSRIPKMGIINILKILLAEFAAMLVSGIGYFVFITVVNNIRESQVDTLGYDGIYAGADPYSGSTVFSMLLVFIIFLLFVYFIAAPISIGVNSMVLNYFKTGRIEISQMSVIFRTKKTTKAALLQGLITVISIGSFIFLFVPAIVVAFVLAFSNLILLEENNNKKSVFYIAAKSSELSKGYKLKLFGYSLLLIIIPVILEIAFRDSLVVTVIYCILLLIAITLIIIGTTIFYLDSKEYNNETLDYNNNVPNVNQYYNQGSDNSSVPPTGPLV